MKLTTLILIFSMVAVILVSGCTTGQIGGSTITDKTMYVCPSGDTVSNPDLCPSVSTPITQEEEIQKGDCPYECCTGEIYKVKGCTGGTTCINNQCIKSNCPYECCKGVYYKEKDCNYNEECVNNVCVKKECPYECCAGSTYQPKSCSSGFNCINNECEEIKKPKLSLSVDGCKTSFNIMQGLGEVTDIYATVTNYGTKEAVNVQITSTANDADSDYYRSRGTIGALPPGESQSFMVTVDTKSGVDTIVSVSASCSECIPVTTNSAQCFTDYDKIIDLAKYIAIFV